MQSELWKMLCRKPCFILRSWPQPGPHFQAADLYLRHTDPSIWMFMGSTHGMFLTRPICILTWQPASVSVTCFHLMEAWPPLSKLIGNQVLSIQSFSLIFTYLLFLSPLLLSHFWPFISHLSFFSNLSAFSLVYFHLILHAMVGSSKTQALLISN